MTTTTTTIDTAAAEARELENAGAWRAMELELELEIDDATQWATIYQAAECRGTSYSRPIATVQRRRVLDKSAPDWTVFDLHGAKLFELWAGGRTPATRIKRRMAAHLVDKQPGRSATVERDDQAAPYAVHAARLDAEGFRLGADADGFDVYRRGDGARAWIDYQDDGGDGLFTVRRGDLVDSASDRAWHAAQAAELTDRERTAAAACQEEEEEPATRFLNHYTCERCGHEWEDEWSCMVDDDCGKCGARHMSPHTSEELERAA